MKITYRRKKFEKNHILKHEALSLGIFRCVSETRITEMHLNGRVAD